MSPAALGALAGTGKKVIVRDITTGTEMFVKVEECGTSKDYRSGIVRWRVRCSRTVAQNKIQMSNYWYVVGSGVYHKNPLLLNSAGGGYEFFPIPQYLKKSPVRSAETTFEHLAVSRWK